jgi:hypothetical protein
MRRREFNTYLGSMAATSTVWPSLLGAQQNAMPVIGFLEIDATFAALVQRQAGALFVSSDPFFYNRRELITALAARHDVQGESLRVPSLPICPSCSRPRSSEQ